MGVVETLLNVNPKLYVKSDERILTDADRDEDVVDEFDEREVFGILYFM